MVEKIEWYIFFDLDSCETNHRRSKKVALHSHFCPFTTICFKFLFPRLKVRTMGPFLSSSLFFSFQAFVKFSLKEIARTFFSSSVFLMTLNLLWQLIYECVQCRNLKLWRMQFRAAERLALPAAHFFQSKHNNVTTVLDFQEI